MLNLAQRQNSRIIERKSPEEREKILRERTKRALVVDDEPGILSLCSTLLRRAGYEVVEARNGRQALEIIQEKKPDVIFLDLMMPLMDGFALCEKVKHNPGTSDIVIAVISALHTDVDMEYAFSLGANFYFPKPVFHKKFLNEILPRIEQALN
ncbi:MAG: response regulator [Chlorobi bacterium]|nr:response regulator [Chlorobiota bacterium]